MIQCIFLLSESGEVMLEKQMTGCKVDRSICDWFWNFVISQGPDPSKILQVIVAPTHYLFQIFRNGIIFLACSQVEIPPLIPIEFLSRVANILSDYLGQLNEDIIKDNFILVYQILDEMTDNGFPLTTEPNILKDMIPPPNLINKMMNVLLKGNSNNNVSEKLPDATSSIVPWRSINLRNVSNEVYVNLVEELDVTINREGKLKKCEIYGEIQMNSSLAGYPELNLSFKNPNLLHDLRFHPCVRFRPWESNQILNFIPPDGSFTLMNYRVKGLNKVPIYIRPQFSCNSGNCRITILAGIKHDPGKTMDSISVQFVLPFGVISADLNSNYGTIDILSDKTCKWTIGQIPKDKSPSLTGNLMLEPGVEKLRSYPNFEVKFKIMGVALSGLQIDKLDVKNNTGSNPYKGFRAQTQAGEFEVRS